MPRKRAVPAEAVRRQCNVCHKGFKPMTDRQWLINYDQHLRLSLRHQRYLALASK